MRTELLSVVFAGTLLAAASTSEASSMCYWRDSSGRMHYGDVCPAGVKCGAVRSTLSSSASCAATVPGTPPNLRSRLKRSSGWKPEPAPQPIASSAPTPPAPEPTPPAPPPVAEAPPAPTPPAPTPPPADYQLLWSAGMEAGNLNEWDDETNSGTADSVAVTAASAGIPPKGGNWVMRMSVTGSSGGTRMARFPEVDALRKTGTPFHVSWWDYFPTPVTYAPGNMFAIWQSASQDAAGGFHPLWGLFFHPSNNTLQLVWSPNNKGPSEGPHAGESGTRSYSSTKAVPVGEWVFFEVMLKPAADFTGAIKVWMNGEMIHDQSLVKTRFPDTGSGGFMWFNLLAYGSGLTPTPLHHYVDDVTISLGRVPYVP